VLQLSSNQRWAHLRVDDWEAASAGSMRRSYILAAISLGVAGLALALYRGERSEERSGIALPLPDPAGRRLFEPRYTRDDSTYSPCIYSQPPDRLLPRVSCSGSAGGDINATVKKLEQAILAAPADARLLSDLAAAYFVRAHAKDEPEDLIRALDAVAGAYAVDPSLPKVLFNRALILERLHLRRVAVEAWNAYLKRDDSSEWSEEARRRRDALKAPSLADRWAGLRAGLDAAALKEGQAAVRTIVEEAPQPAREYAMEDLLPNWGHAIQAGDAEAANRLLRIAEAVGRALEASTGETSIEQAVFAIEKARPSAALASLARGHRALGEGLHLFRKLDTKPARASFETAREELQRGGSPAELWALCGLARCWAYDGRFDEAENAFREIVQRAEDEGSSSLAGWAQWGLGWLDVRRRRFSNALSRFGLAEKAYERTREGENLGAVHHFLGEHLFLLGQDAEAWRYRFRALVDLADLPNSFRRHNVLMEGSYAAFNEGLQQAGLMLQEEDVRIAEETGDPIIFTEALRARGRLQLERHRADQAWRDLEAAKRSARMAPDSAPGRKLLADSLWVQGEALRLRNPAAALDPLSRAVSEYRDLKAPLSVIQALLSRYRAYLALGRDADAESDLAAALRTLEDPGGSIQEEDLKLSYAESIQNVYDEMIDLRWRTFKDGLAALDVLLRAQAFYRFDAAEREAASLRLPKQGVFVAYAVLNDRLLCWLIRDGKVSTLERPIGMATLENQVANLTASLQARSNGDAWLKTSEALYDLLVPDALQDLSADQTVHFVPDKALNLVPFSALRNPKTGRFLIEEHPIAIRPNLLAVEKASFSEPLGAHSSVLLVGNPAFDLRMFPGLPRLRNADAELALVRSLFPNSLVLRGADATRDRVLAELDQADAFIFIGHAVVNASQPSRSFLVLAPSTDPPDAGLLLSDDIAGRKLHRLRLVVLSACSSVGPRSTRTAGVAGLAEPLLRAGVGTVVGTLWQVDDREAGELLAFFYRDLARGQPAIPSLRHAQLEAIWRSRTEARPSVEWAALEVVSL
jgi:CHAT domain-containing protein